jgi:predicted Zn-dependent peptidase
VLAEALAGGLDSRMGRLRTRSGWLYAFDHVVTDAGGDGRLIIRAEVSPGRANDLITAVFREAADLATVALPDEELRAVSAGRARALETSLSWAPAAHDLASEAWRCRSDLGALALQPDRLRAVAAAEVRDVARTYLDPATAHVFVTGPREQLRLAHPALAPAEAISWSDSQLSR